MSADGNPRARLRQLTDDCTVYVVADGIAGGSGFFVAPGVVLTCAHVVADGVGVVVPEVTIRWRGTTYSGTTTALPPTGVGGGLLWPPPDLCVIRLADPPSQHPMVVLGEVGEADRQEVHIAGYNNVYDPGMAQFHSSASGRLAGTQELAGAMVRQLAGVEIPGGMSGGPVLDLQRGVVFGVTKATRMPNSDLGGLMIPGELVKTAFPDAWRENQIASEADSEWDEQREALIDLAAPDVAGTSPAVSVNGSAGVQVGSHNVQHNYFFEPGATTPQQPQQPALRLPYRGLRA